MKRRFIPTLSLLMTISLIIFVGLQIYWIKQAVDATSQEFRSRVIRALETTTEKVNEKELSKFYNAFGKTFQNNILNKDKKDSTAIRLAQSIIDSATSKTITYTKIWFKDENIPIPFSPGDTLKVGSVFTDEGVLRIKKNPKDKNLAPLSLNLESNFNSPTFTLKEFARLNINQLPLESRITISELDSVIKKEFKIRDIDEVYEIGILDHYLHPTKIKTKNFSFTQENSNNFNMPLYYNSKDTPTHYLSVYLPNKQFSILTKNLIPIITTVTTTVIIVLIYMASIYYMSKQRKISEIKTDFINNMSHEFKTPIATINIATDALKNDLIASDKDKVKYYSELIKKENKRMSTQVEMVLRMSKLERNEIEFNFKKDNMRTLIKECVDSMKLAVEQRGGTIVEEYNAEVFYTQIDEFHMKNAIINLLDNANKYSPEKPEIKIVTRNEDGLYILEIIDNGIGMETSTQKKIFEKFYREETGNIHNVKGHGLGLAYVKKVIEKHLGEINVISEKNKGSSFIIKIPIN